MDRVLNARIRELRGVAKGVDERIDKSVLRRFCHIERRENDRTAKRIYVGGVWVDHGGCGLIRECWGRKKDGV